MAQLARVATKMASNKNRVFVIGVGMTKVRRSYLRGILIQHVIIGKQIVNQIHNTVSND